VGVLGAFAVNLNGKAAAAKTRARRRNVFHTCMEYAVTRKLLVSNPVTGVRLGGRTRADETVDPRTVPGMEAARRLLAAVGTLKTKTAGRAVHLAVFFAVMYYAGMRPAEVRGLKLADLVLPSSGGWGRAMLSGSVPEVGGAWSDDGERYSGQTLKHRAVGAVRIVPLPPTLVAVLLAHIAMWGTAADGRIFFDGPDQVMVSSGVLDRTWERARKAALTDAELAAGLAKRPYDLRHGCASYLLSLGTVPVKVAAWLGHSLPVLMNTYTHFIDGDETAALARIEAAHKAAEAATLPVTGGFPGGGLPAGQTGLAEAA
jgi:integrase